MCLPAELSMVLKSDKLHYLLNKTEVVHSNREEKSNKGRIEDKEVRGHTECKTNLEQKTGQDRKSWS